MCAADCLERLVLKYSLYFWLTVNLYWPGTRRIGLALLAVSGERPLKTHQCGSIRDAGKFSSAARLITGVLQQFPVTANSLYL